MIDCSYVLQWTIEVPIDLIYYLSAFLKQEIDVEFYYVLQPRESTPK